MSIHHHGFPITSASPRVAPHAATLRRLVARLAITAVTLASAACTPVTDVEDEDEGSSTPTTPSTLAGRPVEVQGTVDVASRNVVFNVWDSSQIDGDIITLYVNGSPVLQNYTLTGSKRGIPFTLDPGYNYVLLYAHNEGSVSPNTAAVSIVESGNETTLVLSADLRTNGAYNIRVR
jgi:hypothetical protein